MKKQKISWYKLGIESELWKKFKIKCAINGQSMIEVITDLIKKYTK